MFCVALALELEVLPQQGAAVNEKIMTRGDVEVPYQTKPMVTEQ